MEDAFLETAKKIYQNIQVISSVCFDSSLYIVLDITSLLARLLMTSAVCVLATCRLHRMKILANRFLGECGERPEAENNQMVPD